MDPTSAKPSRLVEMLTAFVEGKARSLSFAGEIETEFARTGLDEEEDFSELQHALALYRGTEADEQVLEREARWAIQQLSRK
jgi:hypothetical protein